jgi:hypothetical protein
METTITIPDYTETVNIQSYCVSVYRSTIKATLKRLAEAMADTRCSMGSLGIDVNFSSLETKGFFELESLGKTVVGKVGVKLVEPGTNGDQANVFSKIDFWHQPHSQTPPTLVLSFFFDEVGKTDIKINDAPASFNSHTFVAVAAEAFVRLTRLDSQA